MSDKTFSAVKYYEVNFSAKIFKKKIQKNLKPTKNFQKIAVKRRFFFNFRESLIFDVSIFESCEQLLIRHCTTHQITGLHALKGSLKILDIDGSTDGSVRVKKNWMEIKILLKNLSHGRKSNFWEHIFNFGQKSIF